MHTDCCRKNTKRSDRGEQMSYSEDVPPPASAKPIAQHQWWMEWCGGADECPANTSLSVHPFSPPIAEGVKMRRAPTTKSAPQDMTSAHRLRTCLNLGDACPRCSWTPSLMFVQTRCGGVSPDTQSLRTLSTKTSSSSLILSPIHHLTGAAYLSRRQRFKSSFAGHARVGDQSLP